MTVTLNLRSVLELTNEQFYEKLSNGAERSPDASWIRWKRWDSLSSRAKAKISSCILIL